MQISTEVIDKSLIVTVQGEIDHHTASAIKDKTQRDYNISGALNIIFDFTGVSFMDSSGIGMLIGRYKLIEQSGGSVSVCSASDNINRIFSMSGLPKIIKSYKTLDQALKAIS